MSNWLRQLFTGKKEESRVHSTPTPSRNSGKEETDQMSWTTYCRSCHAKVILPRTTPPFGTALICSTCKTPLQRVHEDPPGCPVGWSPQQVQVTFGYHGCSIEHPRCPWCGKIAYAIVFPEQGREVAWSAVQEQENPMANYTIRVECPNCSRTFAIEWDGWPFSFDSRKQCCFCGLEVIGDDQPMAFPEDKLAQFEELLGRKASKMAYLKDEEGKPLWYACPTCLKTALKAFDQQPGTDLAQAYSIGPDLDQFVNELLLIDQKEGLMNDGRGPACAYDSKSRHKRGREIGEILCKRGDNKLMVRVGEAFVNRGGTEWRLSHCWNEIKDNAGNICWFA
jgi:hypothetical protein